MLTPRITFSDHVDVCEYPDVCVVGVHISMQNRRERVGKMSGCEGRWSGPVSEPGGMRQFFGGHLTQPPPENCAVGLVPFR